MKGTCPVMSPLPTPLTCPLRIMFMTSYPCSVRPAVSTKKKPIPGLTNRLIKRWSCSTRLLRYLTCLSSTDSGSVPVALRSAMALGIDVQTPFPHHFLQIAVAERVSQVPAHAQQNDLRFKMTPFERILVAHEGNSSAVFEYRRVYYTTSVFAT